MNIGKMNSRITFQRTIDDGETWENILSCSAYINGLSGNEFFIANAGSDSALVVEISCRYQPALMEVIPTEHRAVEGKHIYDLLSPADDKGAEHKEIIFRARRLSSSDL